MHRQTGVTPFTMSLRQFLDQRESDLRKERAAFMEKVGAIDAELMEIRRARGAIDAQRVPGLLAIAAGLESQGSEPYSQWTLKQLAVRALRDHFPYGATANQLLEVFRNAYGREIPRESLSPQLSRLRQQNIIKLDGKTWNLVGREEPPSTSGGGSFVVGGSNGVRSASASAKDQH